jgi:hypothetical protein
MRLERGRKPADQRAGPAGSGALSMTVYKSAVVEIRFLTRRPDLGGLVGNNAFDESA